MSVLPHYNEDVASFACRWYREQYVNVAVIALLFYEYFITLRREITAVWGQSFSAATLLFLANRYLAILYGLCLISADHARGHISCNINTRLFQAASQFLAVIFALFSALRVYAILNRSKALFTLILVINAIPIGANIYIHVNDALMYTAFPFTTQCMSRSLLSPTLHTELIRSARVCVMFGDAIVLFVTWWKTLSIRREASSARIKVTLTYLLIRDGTIFFFSLLALNLVQAILIDNSEVPGYMMAPLNVITPILISRFMLDLREVGHDVPDPMDISYFAGPAIQWSVLGVEHCSTTTLGAVTPVDGQDATNDEDHNADQLSMDHQDIELPIILKAESSEMTDVESVNGISEVPRSGSSSRTF